MTDHYDWKETRDHDMREADLFSQDRKSVV